MKKLPLFLLAIFLVLLSACSSTTPNTLGTQDAPPRGMMGGASNMGMGSGMMARHSASIPNEYIGLTNPGTADDESLARGAEIYTTQCASCHGDGGMGDGPAGSSLDPAPAPIAHTSQMLGDDYLFWRISEGGMMAPFNSTMPAWKETLNEEARWDVINYLRALSSGQIMPQQALGGDTFNPEAETARRAEMLAQAVEQNVLTQAEAELFNQIHIAMDNQIAAGSPKAGSMAQMEETMLAELLEASEITQAQADAFSDIHNRLLESGLMQ